jgi:hypothetical protein
MKRRLLFILCFILGVGGFAFAQRRTVTNEDLEKYRQRRLAAERDYRENYEKMGFPSPEELNRQIEEDKERSLKISEQLRVERLRKEGDFGTRASILRAEIAAVEAQINYLRAQMPVFSPLIAGNYAVTVSGGRSGFTRHGRLNSSSGSRVNSQRRAVPRFQSPGNVYPPFNAGNMANVRIGVNLENTRGYGNTTRGVRGGFRNGYVALYPPVIINNTNYTQQELTMRLQTLEQQYAGLLAEWRVLEEEARRAGVRID